MLRKFRNGIMKFNITGTTEKRSPENQDFF